MMGEHEHRVMEGRIVAPPAASLRIVVPGPLPVLYMRRPMIEAPVASFDSVTRSDSTPVLAALLP
jgi:hypothetical protein